MAVFLTTMLFGAFGGRPRKVGGTSWWKDVSPHTAEQPRKVFGRVLRKGLLCHQGMLTMVRHDNPWLTMVSHGYGYHGYTPWSAMLHHGYPKYPGCVCGGQGPLVFMVSEHKRRLRELYPSCLDQFEVDDRALDAQRDSC